MRLWRRWTDDYVRPNLFKACLRDAADGQQIVDAAEWAALLAELNDVFRRDWPDARQLFEFFDRCGVQINRLCRRLLLRGCYRLRSANAE